MLSTGSLKTTVENALAGTFGRSFSRAEIREGENYEGARALYVKAFLKPDMPRPDSVYSLRAMVALRSALQQAGEDREPYLDLDYPVDVSA